MDFSKVSGTVDDGIKDRLLHVGDVLDYHLDAIYEGFFSIARRRSVFF